MNYLSVTEIAKLCDLSERSVRNYCAEGRILGAMLVGKTWMIPSDAVKPERKVRVSNNKKTLLDILKLEKESKLKGGIYHKVQIELTYNSNHIEGSHNGYAFCLYRHIGQYYKKSQKHYKKAYKTLKIGHKVLKN